MQASLPPSLTLQLVLVDSGCNNPAVARHPETAIGPPPTMGAPLVPDKRPKAGSWRQGGPLQHGQSW